MRITVGRQPDACRRDHPAEHVPARADTEHRRSGLDLAGAQFGTAQVHHHPAGTAQRLLGPPQVFDHALPGILVVVRAIDAHAVHALFEQGVDERVVCGGLTGHGDHDPHLATRCGRPEQTFGMTGEQVGALGKIPLRWVLVRPFRCWFGQLRQGVEDGVQGCKHMRFSSAQRRQPEGRQSMLERAEIAPPERQVMEQVPGALRVIDVHRIEEGLTFFCLVDQFGTQGGQFGKQGFLFSWRCLPFFSLFGHGFSRCLGGWAKGWVCPLGQLG